MKNLRMKMFFVALVIALVFFTMPISTSGDVVTITQYDVEEAANDTFGGWLHFYDGDVTGIGTGIAHEFGFEIVNYTGGSGTLNDGVLGTGTNNTELFANNNDANPRIRLQLDGHYRITDITLHSFAGLNTIPGSIAEVSLSINGMQESFATSGGIAPGDDSQEFIDLNGSTLASKVTDEIVLSDFVSDGSSPFHEMFAISEIVVRGVQIPEPGLLPIGLVITGGLAFRRTRAG